MKKLFAMYAQPADEAAFLRHYNEVHTPLVEKIPGLARLVVNRVQAAPLGGEPPYFLIAEMHFADNASFTQAMRSPENRAAGDDLADFAQGLVTLLVVEDG